MNFLSLIEAKREGRALTPGQIQAMVSDYTGGSIPDYQMAAMLMAVFFRGLSEAETRALALAMRDSGQTLQFPDDPRPLVDKHSTGGVGDKVSLPLAPLLACLGFRVPMISGRGLGITGGTLDKLESIPGFKTRLEPALIVETVQRVGCVICGQTERMVPADRAIYGLRDVTGTVPSVPLITASIVSKKLAEGLQALLLDVKFGAAAFMPTLEEARPLARSMINLCSQCGLESRALLTGMNTPLGRAAGNWLEVKESGACLDGHGPSDLRHLVVECAAHLLVLTRPATELRTARAKAAACLDSGAPRRKWEEMLAAQGADLDAFRRRLALDQGASAVVELAAPQSGFVRRCDARVVGEVVRALGGGRLTKDSLVRPDVGIDRLVKPGEAVHAGAALCRIHADDPRQAEEARRHLAAGFEVGEVPCEPPDLIAEVITSSK